MTVDCADGGATHVRDDGIHAGACETECDVLNKVYRMGVACECAESGKPDNCTVVTAVPRRRTVNEVQ